ncbi:MAG TPA: lipocalin-like domain-containing protein, partial [Longimicrobiales bacterium]|nr:lipocalin-like domain-containing protein [Longimicrobiales bacterium]
MTARGRWRTGVALGAAAVAAGAALVTALRDGGEAEEVRATLNLAEAMGGADTAGYARALEPRPFVFPADHGPHPAFRTEWWYVTANLDGPGGRRFGVQFTLFRNALAPEPDAGAAAPDSVASAWATRQIYMGHFAVTDVAGDAFHEAERFTRAAAGLAGGTADPLRIWMDDWSLTGGGEPDPDAPAAGAVFPLRMTAAEGPVAVTLELSPAKPPVLQGDRGLSQKGPEPGNASYYYSFSRLEASGRITVEGVEYPVTGTAWLDREWSTSALSPGQVGWDWFALQLSDGRDLMVYRLRRDDGSTDPLSKGVLVEADGTSRRLSSEEFALAPLETWRSPLDGTEYPSVWRVTLPGEGVDLRVAPVRRDQELNVTVR